METTLMTICAAGEGGGMEIIMGQTKRKTLQTRTTLDSTQ